MTAARLAMVLHPSRRASRFGRGSLGARLTKLGRDPTTRVLVVVALLMLAAAGAFAHLAEDYLTGDPIVTWDVRFAAWLHHHSAPVLVDAFKVLTLAGNVVVLFLVTLAACAYLLSRRAFNEAVLVCAVAVGIEVLNAGLKLAFHRPRPEVSYVHLDTYSFPSGHAAGSAAIYGGLLFLLALRGGVRRWIACGLAFLVAVAAIGFSRLYLEAHYLSDVLAGLSLGVLWLAVPPCLLWSAIGPSIACPPLANANGSDAPSHSARRVSARRRSASVRFGRLSTPLGRVRKLSQEVQPTSSGARS